MPKLLVTESRLTDVRGAGLVGMHEKGEGGKQAKKQNKTQTNKTLHRHRQQSQTQSAEWGLAEGKGVGEVEDSVRRGQTATEGEHSAVHTGRLIAPYP